MVRSIEMADRQSWRPILFHCPRTGQRVQGLIAQESFNEKAGHYETVSCIACSGVHFVNAETETVLGASRPK
jgi:hypothetical protein